MVRILLCLLFASACLAQVGLKDPVFVSDLRPSAAAPTPDILWWKLNEGSGTSITGDGTNGGDDGSTDADWTTGKSGSGYALDFVPANSDDCQSTANITYGASTITVSAWFYSDSNASYKFLWGMGWYLDNQYAIACYNDAGTTIFGMTGSSGYLSRSLSTPATGAWHHYLVIYNQTANANAGSIDVYLDGVLQSTSLGNNTKMGGANFNAGLPFTIGKRSGGYDDLYYDGRMDDVRIYSGDRSADVTAILNDPQ